MKKLIEIFECIIAGLILIWPAVLFLIAPLTFLYAFVMLLVGQ